MTRDGPFNANDKHKLTQSAGYQKAKVFYNNKTQEEVESSNVLGIDCTF